MAQLSELTEEAINNLVTCAGAITESAPDIVSASSEVGDLETALTSQGQQAQGAGEAFVSKANAYSQELAEEGEQALSKLQRISERVANLQKKVDTERDRLKTSAEALEKKISEASTDLDEITQRTKTNFQEAREKTQELFKSLHPTLEEAEEFLGKTLCQEITEQKNLISQEKSKFESFISETVQPTLDKEQSETEELVSRIGSELKSKLDEVQGNTLQTARDGMSFLKAQPREKASQLVNEVGSLISTGRNVARELTEAARTVSQASGQADTICRTASTGADTLVGICQELKRAIS